jgi:hypothetical protein
MESIAPEEIYLFVLIGFFVLGILAVYIFFLLEQQNILKAIQPENRLMRPGEVWLQLIPIFNYVWQFIVVIRISDSIQREFASWENDNLVGLPDVSVADVLSTRPTYEIGLAFCILNCCQIIPFVGAFAGIAGVICWIIYWVKLVEFRKRIQRRFF